MQITVIGLGYLGLSNAVLLALRNNVRALEISQDKVDMVNNGISPILDKEIQEFLATKDLNLEATSDAAYAYAHKPEFVVVAAPTDYDDEKDYFNTSILESVL